MSAQALLPILEEPPPTGRPDPDAEAIRRRAGVEYHELSVRHVLNRCNAPRLPFDWTINPYRGCEFGCTYCYARYTHGFFDLTSWRDFERKIFVKKEAATSLARALRRRALHGQPIAIGTATDPYQPAERHHGVTRSLLETFLQAEGLEISITTKSPLVLRDLDLLAALDRVHSITVHVTVTTVDRRLARRVERYAPEPAARLRTVSKLAAEGIATSIFCMPLMPGINDDRPGLTALMQAARDAGAFDVVASALFLRPAARARFWPWLREEFPHLEGRYRALYGRRDYLRERDRELLMKTFRRLRLEHGFPIDRPGRT